MPPRLHRLGLTEAGVGSSPNTKPLLRASKRRPRAANEAFRDRTKTRALECFCATSAYYKREPLHTVAGKSQFFTPDPSATAAAQK